MTDPSTVRIGTVDPSTVRALSARLDKYQQWIDGPQGKTTGGIYEKHYIPPLAAAASAFGYQGEPHLVILTWVIERLSVPVPDVVEVKKILDGLLVLWTETSQPLLAVVRKRHAVVVSLPQGQTDLRRLTIAKKSMLGANRVPALLANAPDGPIVIGVMDRFGSSKTRREFLERTPPYIEQLAAALAVTS